MRRGCAEPARAPGIVGPVDQDRGAGECGAPRPAPSTPASCGSRRRPRRTIPIRRLESRPAGGTSSSVRAAQARSSDSAASRARGRASRDGSCRRARIGWPVISHVDAGTLRQGRRAALRPSSIKRWANDDAIAVTIAVRARTRGRRRHPGRPENISAIGCVLWGRAWSPHLTLQEHPGRSPRSTTVPAHIIGAQNRCACSHDLEVERRGEKRPAVGAGSPSHSRAGWSAGSDIRGDSIP